MRIIITQEHPDETLFADIFPRYDMFLKWLGFTDSRLIRACGIGPARIDAVPAGILLQAESADQALMA